MARTIRFVEGTEADLPRSGQRIGGSELKALEQVFYNHIVEDKHKAGPADKPRCHIIGCIISDTEGVVCWYHCH